jgi:hypothetical protein
VVKNTWKSTKGHHWMDNPTRDEIPFGQELYSDFTTPMSGEEHVQAHRDTKKHGVIGAISRFELGKWDKPKH